MLLISSLPCATITYVMSDASNNADKTRGRPFLPGNKFGKGRPAGSRNKATLMLETLLDGEGEDVVRTMVSHAKNGNMGAAKALLDRLVPPRKDRPVPFPLPPITSITDVMEALSIILDGMATGELTPQDSQALMNILAGYMKIYEATEFEQRLTALEGRLGNTSSN